jgi:hypothetical protein
MRHLYPKPDTGEFLRSRVEKLPIAQPRYYITVRFAIGLQLMKQVVFQFMRLASIWAESMQTSTVLRITPADTERRVGPALVAGPQFDPETVRRSSVAKPMEDWLSGDPTSTASFQLIRNHAVETRPPSRRPNQMVGRVIPNAVPTDWRSGDAKVG